MSGRKLSRLVLAMVCCFGLMFSIASPLLAQGTQSPAQKSNTSPAVQGGTNTTNTPATTQTPSKTQQGTTTRQKPSKSTTKSDSKTKSDIYRRDNERQGGASTGAGPTEKDAYPK